MENFNELKLSKALLENLKSLGYNKPTPIQALSVPPILEQKDLIAQAKTGSGKTLAFSFAVEKQLDVKRFRIQSMILCPTRELASQVAQSIRKTVRHIHNVKVLELCGGVPFKPQVASLRHGAHIIVGTPGRILKHFKEGNLHCEELKLLVLDEADRMLEMGFNEDIHAIEKELPKKRQTLLFSATFPNKIESLCQEILNAPIKVSVDEKQELIKQNFYELEPSQRVSYIPSLIAMHQAQSVIIFVNQKRTCEELADTLYEMGYDMLTLHSDLEQKERVETLTLFENGSYPIMIATDVAARGLDIPQVELVINYDLALDEKVHTHRVGRTGRAGKQGVAISFFEQEDEAFAEIHLQNELEIKDVETIKSNIDFNIEGLYRTVIINGGKKNKLRPGDILGALINKGQLEKDDIGKIKTLEFNTYVAIKKEKLKRALDTINNNRMKNRLFRAYKV